MSILVKQEYYKIIKQRSNLFFLIGMFILQIAIAAYTLKYSQFLSTKDAFVNNYFAYLPTIFFFIAICSTSITKERQYGTLRSLLYRQYSYNQVLLSKIIALVTYTIFIFLISSVFSVILKLTLFHNLTLTKTIWKNFALTNLSQFLTLLFLMSFVILLGTFFNNSNLALTTGIIGYFAINIFNQLFLYLVIKFKWLKWNPLNMMNLGSQLQDNRLHKLTQLSLPELSIGYSLYIVLFLALALYSFRKRNV